MLSGNQLLVLQACNDLPGDSAGFVDEAEIADCTQLQLRDVRDCIESLHEKGNLASARLTDRYTARITADGRQVLRQHRPFPDDEPSGSRNEQPSVKVVPKGLRAFDEHDADFFLELLPGPRRESGLPESIHFWKVRIEETDPDRTFAVGVVYGPSGCGKSSLVKAGLLPRLGEAVIPIYIEATAGETEARLYRRLRKHVPDLPTDLDLPRLLIALKDWAAEGAKKVLLVLDQFEQWLHARRAEEDTELVQALRHCDGERVQALVLVRVDFWMALTRFMAQLGIELQQSRNFAAVDLFDMSHAKKVLVAFGQAYGALPRKIEKITGGQQEFLDEAVSGLAQDGRVISVRLALFAEMVEKRPWTPATLKDVGGMEGVGVTFLDETFSSPQANPMHRLHQRAAQAVLKALLPESGSDIKGHMRSHRELSEASGYAARPTDFDVLLRVLDGELRLITPTDPEGLGDEGGSEPKPPGERYYQLTHDYLVPSIREWLVRKQKETWRGRAELRLADRSALWNAKPENRHLPSAWEWGRIWLLTKTKDWTEPQRRMMRRAGRVHGMRMLGLALVLILVGWGSVEGYGSLRASSLVESLATANTTDVPRLIEQLAGYRRWANPRLIRLTQDSKEDPRIHLHASLALLPVDAGQVEYLYHRLLEARPARPMCR